MTSHTLTDAEQACYAQLDADVTAGRVQRVGPVHHRDGSPITDDELDAILRGRPSLGHHRATGASTPTPPPAPSSAIP